LDGEWSRWLVDRRSEPRRVVIVLGEARNGKDGQIKIVVGRKVKQGTYVRS
jgi:hypothetical protein